MFMIIYNYPPKGRWIVVDIYLKIIPRARMGYESIARETEGRMGYWLRGYEGERNKIICFSKIQLVGQKNIKKNIFREWKLD